MWAFSGDFRSVFWIAVVPAFLATALLILAVKEPKRPAGPAARNPLSRAELVRLPPLYRAVVVIAALFTLARFSEAFLILRASEAGTSATLVPLVLVGMNLVYALSAYPFGALSDRMSRHGLLTGGLSLLILADLLLGLAPGLWGVGAGVLVWGLHMGMTQGLLSAMVADAAPADLRGRDFGVFNLVSGLAMLLASLIAGIHWERLGASASFLSGARFAALALAGAVVLHGRRATRRREKRCRFRNCCGRSNGIDRRDVTKTRNEVDFL